jgi:hypothetical protein
LIVLLDTESVETAILTLSLDNTDVVAKSLKNFDNFQPNDKTVYLMTQQEFRSSLRKLNGDQIGVIQNFSVLIDEADVYLPFFRSRMCEHDSEIAKECNDFPGTHYFKSVHLLSAFLFSTHFALFENDCEMFGPNKPQLIVQNRELYDLDKFSKQITKECSQ